MAGATVEQHNEPGTTVSQPQAPPRRTLVGEIMLTQLGYAMVIGCVALASLWSSANWIIQENMAELAERWIDDLDAFGVALYLDTDVERYLHIEGYLAKFPEIAYARYYNAEGEVVFLETSADTEPTAPALTESELNQLRHIAVNSNNHRLEDNLEQAVVRISAAIVVTSIAADGLFDAPSLDAVMTEHEIVGFVELGLDYSRYDAQLWRHTTNASIAVGLAFLFLALIGCITLRRALQPLRDLQEPLAKLANGDTDFEVGGSSHREIATITNTLSDAVLRIRERDAHLRYLAHHDDLTGLPNRHSLMNMLRDVLERPAGRQENQSAVLFVDLDQFKYVNDTLGHLAGDAILNQVAGRIRSCVGDSGQAARFGGDEFSIVMTNATPAQSLRLANDIMASLAGLPFIYSSQSFNLTCSIGIANVDRAKTLQADEVLAYADLACQLSKTDGRNRVRVYEPDAGAMDAIKLDVGWSQKLTQALKHDHFTLLFQPIAQIGTGNVSHFEVLLRLEDDEGLHGPGAFLPAASRFGLMNDIDRWVIEHAFRSLAWFRRQDPDLRFTINISGGSFVEGDLVEVVKSHLRLNALDPAAVIFEITEQVAVNSFVNTTSQINELIELGCEFALDDFGAGYSSFTYLKKLPMQYVKIDGQFIQDLHNSKVDQAMVRSIAEVARTLGKKTIAEYVEHEATLRLLAEFGIDYAQGFFIGEPRKRLDMPQQPGKDGAGKIRSL